MSDVSECGARYMECTAFRRESGRGGLRGLTILNSLRRLLFPKLPVPYQSQIQAELLAI